MNDYLILTFVDGETVVIHDDLRFDTNLKPELFIRASTVLAVEL